MALITSPWVYWPLVALALGAFALLWGRRTGRLAWAFWLRLLLVCATLFAVFNPPELLDTHTLPSAQVLLLDVSTSVAPSAREAAMTAAAVWQAGQINRQVFVFGADEVMPDLAEGWVVFTDLTAALESFARNHSDNSSLILATDGFSDASSTVAAQLAALAEDGYAVEILPLPPRTAPNDLAVTVLAMPDRVWGGTAVPLVASITAPSSGTVSLLLTVNGSVVDTMSIDVQAGENTAPFVVQAGSGGILTAELVASWEGDPALENNVAFAAAEVLPPPDALIVSAELAASQPLADALLASGIAVEMVTPDALPVSTGGLDAYQVILLDNVLAHALTDEQQLALDHFVADQGRGLVVLGGRSSYALGGYEGTLLETMLPVSLQPPPRSERPPITFVMVLDRSGSMQGERGLPIRPIDLAKEAAIRAVETLHPDDFLGVMTYSGEPVWDVLPRQLGSGLTEREAIDAISQISPQGGTNTHLAMETALGTILDQRATQAVHILLLTDGISFDGSPEEFTTLALLARTHDISISTVALGTDTDPATLEAIAEIASGRFFAVSDAAELPRILVAESKAARAENVQEGTTNLALNVDDHPLLLGITPADLPAVTGYNAVSSKRDQGAEDILLSGSFQDPLLSAWGYGLGRVIAWTADSGGEWAQGWPAETAFWGQLTRYALPDPSISSTQLSIRSDGDTLHIEMQVLNAEGVPVNFAAPEFSYVNAEGAIASYALTQTAPGRYSTLIAQPQPGAYRGLVGFIGAQGYQEIAAPFVIDLDPDLFPPDPVAAGDTLARWQAAAEAKPIEWADLTADVAEVEDPADDSWRTPLLAALLLGWVADIAARRRWLPWR